MGTEKISQCPNCANQGLELAFHIQQILQHFVHRCNDARVRLESALSNNKVSELAAQVYVGLLQESGVYAARLPLRGVPTTGTPELSEARTKLLPTRSKPAGFGKIAIES